MARYLKRSGRNSGLYQVGTEQAPATKDDVEDLLDSVPNKKTYSVIITGRYSRPYEGQEGEDIISLSYAMDSDDMLETLDYEKIDDATDWANIMVYEEMPNAGYWEEVITISIVDRNLDA